jgi:hypothetical protein
MAICKTYWSQVSAWAETLIWKGEVKLPTSYSAALLKADLLVALKQLAGESPVKYRLQRRRAPYLHFVLEIRR